MSNDYPRMSDAERAELEALRKKKAEREAQEKLRQEREELEQLRKEQAELDRLRKEQEAQEKLRKEQEELERLRKEEAEASVQPEHDDPLAASGTAYTLNNPYTKDDVPPQKPQDDKPQDDKPQDDKPQDDKPKDDQLQDNKRGGTTSRKRKLRWVAALSAVLLVLLFVLFFRPEGSTPQAGGKKPAKGTNEWVDTLPSKVTADDYEIEERVVYRSRERSTTQSTEQSEMEGWELYDTVEGTGDYGPWSEWSLTPCVATDDRQVETQTRYSYQDRETTTGDTSSLSGWTLYDTSYSWSDYGAWSGWSTTPASASDNIQVETKTIYSYRDKTTCTSTESSLPGWELEGTAKSYGSWSPWSTEYVEPSDTLNVQTYDQQVGTRYYMAHYCTGNVSGARYNVAPHNHTGNQVFNEKCIYHELGWFDDLNKFKYDSTWNGYDGYLYYPNGSKYTCANSCWTFYLLSQKPIYETNYRYQTITTYYYYYQWGDWSEYTDTPYTSSDTRQVQTRTLYRTRERQQIPTYHFYRWGQATPWSTQAVSPNENRRVETALYYRYSDRVYFTTYYFQKWSDWSEFGTTPIEASDTVEVETKTQYRYKLKET